MKNLVLWSLTIVISATGYPNIAQSADEVPHKVGLIDMAHVFQEYDKFKVLRDDLQAEITKSDAEAKQMVERMKIMQEELKKYTGGSPQYEQAEKALLSAKGDLDAFLASTKRRLARRESEMFKEIYGDVSKAVTLYAEYAKYTLVMRFNRKGIDDASSPAEAVNTMNKTVIYHQNSNDITNTVLQYLNGEYKKSPGARAPARAAGQSRPVN